MKGFVHDIETLATRSDEFRKLLYPTRNFQLMLMALKQQAEISADVQQLDQFFRLEDGSGEVVRNGVQTSIHAGFAVVVPAGAGHQVVNTVNKPLKLCSLHAPPNHRDGVVRHTRADAEADTEHFDGKTSE